MPSVHCLVSGRVQGVGFRFFVRDQATRLGLSGWVRNLPTGQVELLATGPKADLETLINRVGEGPSMGRVESLDTEWREGEETTGAFGIR